MGQVYIALDKMHEMTGLYDHASYFVADQAFDGAATEGWVFQDQKFFIEGIGNDAGI